ncbi:MAG: pilus assembly protein PilP [Aeromonas sp.]
MNRLGLICCCCVLLSACQPEDNLIRYMAQVKAQAPSPTEALPSIGVFIPMSYLQNDERSPFITPQPELMAQNARDGSRRCPQPASDRTKETLEYFSLPSLAMQGTLAKEGQLWGLVRTPDGQSVRVAVGQYLGLNLGQIMRINDTSIELIETIPDGKGCWVERSTALVMANPKAQN